MELVLLKRTLVALPVFEVLRAFAVKHTVVPVSLVLSVPAFPVQHAPTALYTVTEVAFVPTTVRPPESTTPITFSSLELALIDVALFPSPCVYAPSLFLVEPKLPNVVVPSGKVQLALSL